MKKIVLSLILAGVSSFIFAQSIGGFASLGNYSPSFTDNKGLDQTVSGSSIFTIGASFVKNINSNIAVPVSISYAQFGAEHQLYDNQVLTCSANTVSIGAGWKYTLLEDYNAFRPFIQAGVNYEVLVNSSFYYDVLRAGDLDWNSNLYADMKVGGTIYTGLNFIVDIFINYNLGLLNRVDVIDFGTYKDQNINLGVGIYFN